MDGPVAFPQVSFWRRLGIANRYDRCAYTFFSAICIALIFYLP